MHFTQSILFCFQASTNVRSFVTSNAKTKMETPSDIQSGKNTSLELATKKIVSGIKAWGIWSWNFLSVLKFFLSFRSLLKGKLIEINDSVVKNPQLIRTAPLTEGHIGVVLPKLPDGLAELKNRLISKAEYQDYIKSIIS